jgi:hypothetical protein
MAKENQIKIVNANELDFSKYRCGFTNAKTDYINKISQNYEVFRIKNPGLTLDTYVMQEGIDVPMNKIRIELIPINNEDKKEYVSLEDFIIHFYNVAKEALPLYGPNHKLMHKEIKNKKKEEYAAIKKIANRLEKDIVTPDVSVLPCIRDALYKLRDLNAGKAIYLRGIAKR